MRKAGKPPSARPTVSATVVADQISDVARVATALQASPLKLTPMGKLAQGEIALHVSQARHLAGVEVITDPDQHAVLWHYARKDRPWSTIATEAKFASWAIRDKWLDRRSLFWREVEERILRDRAEKYAMQRVTEIEKLVRVRSYLDEYLEPLRDAKGVVVRYEEGHELAGLPKYGLEMPKIDRFIRAMLDLDQQIMLKRGEATTRMVAETNPDGAPARMTSALDPLSQRANLNQSDLHAMARALMKKAQPSLQGAVLNAEEFVERKGPVHGTSEDIGSGEGSDDGRPHGAHG